MRVEILPTDKSRIKDAFLFIFKNAQARPAQPARLWSRNNISVSISVRRELKLAESIIEMLRNLLVLKNFSPRKAEVEDITSRTLRLSSVHIYDIIVGRGIGWLLA